MIKFSGKEFLDSKQVEITLSNGVVKMIREIQFEDMEKFEKMEDASPEAMRETLASFIGGTISDLKGIGVVEVSGLMDFLLNNFIGTASQQEK